MAWVMFHKFKEGQLDGAAQPNAPIDFEGSAVDLRILLLSAEPNVATAQDVADVVASAAEVTESGYARKQVTSASVTLASGTVTVDGSSGNLTYSQDASGFEDARYAVLYKHDASDASAPVICYNDFGTNQNNTSGDLTLQFSSAGIFTLA